MKKFKVFYLVVILNLFILSCLFAEKIDDNPILEAGDSVSVWVMGEPELSVDTIITEEGNILMPLIGYVTIAGNTKDEAIKKIEEAYRDGYLQKPVVHMAVRVTARIYENNEKSVESDEKEDVNLISDNEEETKEIENDEIKEKHEFLTLKVIDAKTKCRIKHADIFFPNKKSRYTDRNGYVKLPISMSSGLNPVPIKIYHKSYEILETSLDYEGEQAVCVKLYKPDYERDDNSVSKEAVIETAKNIVLLDPEEILEAKVSLEFYDSDLKTILKALTSRFDLTLYLSDDNKKYSLRAEDVTVRELLKSLLLAHDCQYSISDGALNVFLPIGDEQKTAKEILFRDMSLKEALRVLAGMMKINVFISPDIQDRTVNFYVDNLNLNELLDLVLETNNLKKEYKGNNSYYIMSR